MCAIAAGRRGRRVWIIESANKPGKKILMSGGGRCNFTNLSVAADNYLSANPRFCRSALAGFSQWDFIAKVEAHGIAYHEKEFGQLFCDESSRQILGMLLAECAALGVTVSTGTMVQSIEPLDGGFQLQTSVGVARCQSLVVASGGLSIPKMGATGFGYDVARQFGHRLRPTRAGLVPLTLSGRPLEQIEGLSGVSLPAAARCAEQEFNSALLFTHRGLSGPAILQISSYWESGQTLSLNLLPERNAAHWLRTLKREHPTSTIQNRLAEVLPRRLAARLCELFGWAGNLHDLKNTDLERIGQTLNAWSVTVSGTEGYRTAEVTLGGVDTRDLSSQTMESRLVPGLYFVGEVVDVTGHLGGFNFQWAWASGHAAGQAC